MILFRSDVMCTKMDHLILSIRSCKTSIYTFASHLMTFIVRYSVYNHDDSFYKFFAYRGHLYMEIVHEFIYVEQNDSQSDVKNKPSKKLESVRTSRFKLSVTNNSFCKHVLLKQETLNYFHNSCNLHA